MSKEMPYYIMTLLCCQECDCPLSVPPVYLTLTEENICGRCVLLYEQKNKTMPLSMRNEIYEIVAMKFAFPCRYANNGCEEKLSIDLMKNHEDQCPNKPE